MRFTGTFIVFASLVLHNQGASAQGISLPDGRKLEAVDFERHVHALLERQGCNAGKCHGNRNGAGGFLLSLCSASPESDFLELTRRSAGRYVNVADPDHSLLLRKATGQSKHEGGMRIAPGSWQYAMIRQWIAQGAKREAGSGQIKSVQLVPSEHVFQAGATFQVRAVAEFADGSQQDVTSFCDFRLPRQEDESKAPVKVSGTGSITAQTPGEVGISVVYRGQVRIFRASVAVPVARDFAYPKVPEANLIDREVFKQLRQLNIVPSDLCGDQHFLRRLYIDLIGSLPTPQELHAFLESKDPDKRAKKIDELLAHPLHADLLAIRLCEMTDLVSQHTSAKAPRSKAAQMAHGWFRKRVLENMPYDQIVAGILLATSREGKDAEAWQREKEAFAKSETGFGSNYAKRATLDIFWRDGGVVRRLDPLFGDFGRQIRPIEEANDLYMEEIAERTASSFLGINLECARCHLHPLDGWTPQDHRAFTNLFGQVRLERIPFKGGEVEKWERAAFGREVYLADPPLQLSQPLLEARRFLADVSGEKKSNASYGLKPRLLGGSEVELGADGRQKVLLWMTDPENRFFARHFVNVLWRHYMGESLVASTDSFTSAHGLGHHPLLDLLAKEFIQSKFDIRQLERLILQSRTYQLSSLPNETNKHDRTHFARTVPRRPDARVHTEMVHKVLETQEDYGPGVPAGIHGNGVAHLPDVFARLGYDNGYRDRITRMVHQFGRNELVSRCEREPGPSSYLHIYGGNELHKYISKSPRVQRLMKLDASRLNELIDELFLASLMRLPTDAERKTVTQYMQRRSGMNHRQTFEDLVWALLNTHDFSRR